MEWSPDSRKICFKGNVKDGGYEMAITAVDGSSSGFQVLTTENINSDFAWHPDGSSILVAKHSSEHAGIRLFLCDPSTAQFELLASQPLDQMNGSPAWSQDGRRIVFHSRPKQQPRLWSTSKTNLE